MSKLLNRLIFIVNPVIMVYDNRPEYDILIGR